MCSSSYEERRVFFEVPLQDVVQVASYAIQTLRVLDTIINMDNEEYSVETHLVRNLAKNTNYSAWEILVHCSSQSSRVLEKVLKYHYSGFLFCHIPFL